MKFKLKPRQPVLQEGGGGLRRQGLWLPVAIGPSGFLLMIIMVADI